MAQDHIELGLFRVAAAGDMPLVGLVRYLLDIIGDSAVESEALGTARFRVQLEECQNRIDAAGDKSELEQAVQYCAALCDDFYRRAQQHQWERDSELAELIDVVQQVVAAVTGSTRRLDDRLTGTSERLTRLVEISDIRILKRRLALELDSLRETIAEQRAAHEDQQRRLHAEVGRLQHQLVRTREEASLDGLTRVGNRVRFDRAIRRWIPAHRQKDATFTLAMIDLDNFKAVNDSCGHQAGDRTLREVARVLSALVRATDVVARYGGDEFAVLLSGIHLRDAERRMEEAERRIRQIALEGLDGAPMAVTSSIGLTEYAAGDTLADVIGRADRALYAAKAEGKARVRSLAAESRSRLFQNGRPVAGVVPNARKVS